MRECEQLGLYCRIWSEGLIWCWAQPVSESLVSCSFRGLHPRNQYINVIGHWTDDAGTAALRYVTSPRPLFLLTDTLTCIDRRDKLPLSHRKRRSQFADSERYTEQRRVRGKRERCAVSRRHCIAPADFTLLRHTTNDAILLRRELIIRPQCNLANIDFNLNRKRFRFRLQE